MQLLGSLNRKLQDEPYLYRIELLDRFVEILERRQLVFVRPSCWSDPLENIIFNATIFKNGKPYEHPAKKRIYGQCWTYDDDSYALWQIYTMKADSKGEIRRQYGVRLTTHLDRLSQLSVMNEGIFYYGMIDYMPNYRLLQLKHDTSFLRGLRSTKLNEDHFRTLLVKRKSYRYENEVRLLCVPGSNGVDKITDHICRLQVEPTDFISSVRFDPTMPYGDFKKMKAMLVDKYGFESRRISQSTLNRGNRFVFRTD